MAPATWDTTREFGHLNDRDGGSFFYEGAVDVEVHKPVSFNWVHFLYSTYAALCPPPPALVVAATRVVRNLYRYSSRILTPIRFFLFGFFFFSSVGLVWT